MSWTVKSSYFEKGTVQWIVCIEKKKVFCLIYANVVLLLYDALNSIDNLTVVMPFIAEGVQFALVRTTVSLSWPVSAEVRANNQHLFLQHHLKIFGFLLMAGYWKETCRGLRDAVAAAADLVAALQALHLDLCIQALVQC